MLEEKIQLEADEVILAKVRKHWFILFMQILSVVLAGFLPLALVFLFYKLSLTESLGITITASTPTIAGFYAAWLLLLWMALFNIWTNYYLDIWTVTNKRLITIDQRGLFYRSTGSFRLERLQDMNVEINGIIATFLDYGILEAQTAGGSEDEFRAHGLPHPRELKAIILKAADELMERSPQSNAQNGGI